MTRNPWINRTAAVVLLLMMFVAGHDAGRHQAVQAHHASPTQCQP